MRRLPVAARRSSGMPVLPDYAGVVLELTDRIPPGRALAYGRVAAIAAELGWPGGPRQVGAVMSAYGSSTCWWRVVRADGRAPRCHDEEALTHYLAEGTPLRNRRPVVVDMVAAAPGPLLAPDDPLRRIARGPDARADVGAP